MPDPHTETGSTTIRVSRYSRDELRTLADADGLTLDESIRRLIRAERQRRMGEALATSDLDDSDRSWLDASAADTAAHAGR